MALDRLTKVDGGGISTTSDYRVGIITATKFVGPIEGDVTGSITATDGTFSGNVTIGGTLTYEDVTNIDSVGIITARDGIDCNADLDVDGHTNLDNVSISGVTTISNSLNVNDNLVVGNSSSDNLTINAKIDSSLIPTSNNTKDLGSSSLQWRDLYVDGHTNLDNVSIAGVSTFQSIATFNTRSNFYGNGGVPLVWGDTGYSGHLSFDGNDNAVIRASSGKALIFQTDHVNTRMTIASGGNVSIEKDLDVDGHTNLDNVSIAGVSTVNTFLQVFGQAGTSDKGLEVRSNSTQNTDTNKAIRVRNNSTTDTFNLSYKGQGYFAGNVGVASAIPGARLDVFGTNGTIAQFGDPRSASFECIRIKNNVASYPAVTCDSSHDTLDLRSLGSVQATIDANNNSTGKYFRVMHNGQGGAGTELFRVQDNGYFGFGIDSPSRRIHVHTSGSGSDFMQFTNDTTGTTSGDGYVFGINAEEDVIHNNFESTNMRFYTAGTERLRITSDGKVGVNRTPTQHPLELQHASEPTVSLWRGSTKGAALQAQSGGTYLYSYENAPLLFSVNSGQGFTERLRIDSTGRVIIANGGSGGTADTNADNFVVKNYTSSASCGISILNSDSQNSVLYFGNASDSKHAEIVWSDASNIFLIGSSNAGASIKFRTADQQDALLIDSSGRVMIGTTTVPSNVNTDDFTLATSGHTGFTIRSGTSHDGQIAFSDGTSGADEYRGQILYKHGSDYMRFVTDAVERLRITHNGRVNIGGNYTQNDNQLHVIAPTGKNAIGFGATIQGVKLGWDGDNSSYDDVRIYHVDYNNAGTYGIANNNPTTIFQSDSVPGSGTVNSTFWFRRNNSGNFAGRNIMNVCVDGDLTIGGAGQLSGASITGVPGSKQGGFGVSKLTIQPNDRTTAFSASDGDTWHDVVIKQRGGATNNAAGIAFQVADDLYHKNAGTGIAAVKNGTNSDYGSDLVFITRPQSAVAEERVRISSTGTVGIGQDPNGNVSTRALLEINAPYSDVSDNDGSADLGTNGHDALLINISGPSAASGRNVGSIAWGHGRRRAAIMGEYQNTDSDYLALAFFTRGSDGPNDFYKSFIINRDGSAGLHGALTASTSDDRLKKDKVEITNALDKVNTLSSFTHKWNDIAVRAGLEEDKEEIGLSAQEVQGLYPCLVDVNNVMKDPEDPDTDYLTVHYAKVVPLLVASIKELTAKNKALEARLDALEGS